METDENDNRDSHDAILRVFDTSDRLGKKVISWRWSDGRRTISPDEQEVAGELIDEAEDRINPDDHEHETEIAHIWIVDETADRVEWLEVENGEG